MCSKCICLEGWRTGWAGHFGKKTNLPLMRQISGQGSEERPLFPPGQTPKSGSVVSVPSGSWTFCWEGKGYSYSCVLPAASFRNKGYGRLRLPGKKAEWKMWLGKRVVLVCGLHFFKNHQTTTKFSLQKRTLPEEAPAAKEPRRSLSTSGLRREGNAPASRTVLFPWTVSTIQASLRSHKILPASPMLDRRRKHKFRCHSRVCFLAKT